MLEKWQNAWIKEAFLEYNILEERIQWIMSVHTGQDCIGTLATDVDGQLGWISPYEGLSLEKSFEIAESSLVDYVNIASQFPKLMIFGGKHYWFLNTSSAAYLVDVFSGLVTRKSMEELLSIATMGEQNPPGAHGNTEIQPDRVPYFNQGTKPWCCPYSTTMVLGWWGVSQTLSNHDQCAYDIARVGQGKDPPNTNEGVYVGCAANAAGQLYGLKYIWHGQMKDIWSCNDYSNTIDDLKGDIYNGYIVAIEVDCDGSSGTKNDLHISVLIGYDDSDKYVWVQDPSGAWTWSGGDTYATYNNLESRWGAWDGNWPFGGFPDRSIAA